MFKKKCVVNCTRTDKFFYASLVLVLLVYLLLFQLVSVSGTSMADTLFDGDYLLMLRSWAVDDFSCGDIIVASKKTYHNGELIIKRIIAVEGQVVDIDNVTGMVYVDGILLEEDYVSALTFPGNEISFPLIVGEDSYFVLGDNRGNSTDSRSSRIGLVHENEIKGKIIFLIFPSNHNENMDYRLDRIGYIK